MVRNLTSLFKNNPIIHKLTRFVKKQKRNPSKWMGFLNYSIFSLI